MNEINGEKRFMAIFKNAAVGIFLVDPEGCFFEANKAFCAMVGYNEDELRLLNCNEISHPEDKHLHHTFFGQLSRGEIDKYNLEKRFMRKDNDYVWVRLTFSAIRDESGGGFLYSIAVVENITPQKKAEHDLENILSKIILDWDMRVDERKEDRVALRNLVVDLEEANDVK